MTFGTLLSSQGAGAHRIKGLSAGHRGNSQILPGGPTRVKQPRTRSPVPQPRPTPAKPIAADRRSGWVIASGTGHLGGVRSSLRANVENDTEIDRPKSNRRPQVTAAPPPPGVTRSSNCPRARATRNVAAPAGLAPGILYNYRASQDIPVHPVSSRPPVGCSPAYNECDAVPDLAVGFEHATHAGGSISCANPTKPSFGNSSAGSAIPTRRRGPSPDTTAYV